VQVISFGDQKVKETNLQVDGFGQSWNVPVLNSAHAGVFNALARNLEIAARSPSDPLVVHCHTWYTHMAGVMIREAHRVPLVLTTHSLEPSRPWKAEQLGEAGYRLSCWIERTAYQAADGVLAVSQGMKDDVQSLYGVDPDKVGVVYNGITPEDCPVEANGEHLRSLGIDPDRPFILFVGRITRQKGIHHFLRMARHIDPMAQIVLAAAAPDTPLMEEEVAEAVKILSLTRSGVVWIREAVDRKRLNSLYAGATVFVCPSVYEPFGIINLEAMAGATPVVASAVGGIPEIVVEGVTGHLVAFASVSAQNPEPQNPEMFAQDLASRVNALLVDPNKARRMGEAGRLRVEQTFSWRAIAKQTFDFYQKTALQFKA
jgi:glycogen synthase